MTFKNKCLSKTNFPNKPYLMKKEAGSGKFDGNCVQIVEKHKKQPRKLAYIK